jgi:hypothetical protein
LSTVPYGVLTADTSVPVLAVAADAPVAGSAANVAMSAPIAAATVATRLALRGQPSRTAWIRQGLHVSA